MSNRPPPRRLRKMRNGRRLWLRLLLAVLLLLVLALGGAGLALWRTLPAAEEAAAIPGLSAPVDITLDARGIPHIRAATEHDAYAAMGWLHARDRMFEMELMRRGAAGRLAEIGGPALLRNDRFVRTLGLARRAEADLTALSADTRAALEAYAAGVNAWIERHGRFAAPEFLLLGKPEPWRPEHSLLWGKVMGLWLAGNWRTELDRARLAAVLPPERIAELWPLDNSPGRPDWPFAGSPPAAQAPPDMRQGALPASPTDAGQLSRLTALLPRFPEPFTLPATASNSWAVAGARTASGKPLLANDPHLGFQAPILWYLARIDLPGGHMLAGATSPGVPFIVIGRNEHLAWGFTNNGADVQDLFVEHPVGDDRYETPNGPQPFTITEEHIPVRGAEPVTLRVRETRHGPVISDLDEASQGPLLALSAANLAPADTAAAGLLALNRARNLAEAKAAAAAITSPVQNLMVADAAGEIGLFTTGRVPLRRAGDGSQPVPGWDGSHDWTGWVPSEALPAIEQPESGVLVNANNRTAPADYPVFMGRDWFGEWRFRRIGERLEQAGRLDAAAMAAIQPDNTSLLAREALAEGGLLRRMPRPHGAAAAALDLLTAWDGNMAPQLPQPLIFNAWLRRFSRLAMTAGGVPEGNWGMPGSFVQELMRRPELAPAWCRGDCASLAAQALEQAVAQLQALAGPDPAAWRWGSFHVAWFEHPLLAHVPVLAALTRLEALTGGDGQTVNQGALRGGDGAAAFRNVHGAGLRLVADLADTEATLAIIATGQSGNPLSPHWGDQLDSWRDGQMLHLAREPERVTGRLRLNP
jgi:penicillin G amidase